MTSSSPLLSFHVFMSEVLLQADGTEGRAPEISKPADGGQPHCGPRLSGLLRKNLYISFCLRNNLF